MVRRCEIVLFGRLAQLVEHPVYTGQVRGSSPLAPTIMKEPYAYACGSFIFKFVRMRGLEPPRIAPYASEAYAYTNSATCAWSHYINFKTFAPAGSSASLTRFARRVAVTHRSQIPARRHSLVSRPRLAVCRARQTSLRLSIPDEKRAGAFLWGHKTLFVPFCAPSRNRTYIDGLEVRSSIR